MAIKEDEMDDLCMTYRGNEVIRSQFWSGSVTFST